VSIFRGSADIALRRFQALARVHDPLGFAAMPTGAVVAVEAIVEAIFEIRGM
jgi:hypothetical protein